MKVKGNSQISDSPILAAAFWKPGTVIAGKVTRHVDTSNGPITEVKFDVPREIEGTKRHAVMIGNHAGLRMCAESAHVAWPYPLGCHVEIKSTGVQKTPKGKMVMFEVEFDIPEAEDLIEAE